MCEKLLPSSSLICDSETFMTFSLVLRGLHTCHCIKLNEFDFFEKNLSAATFFCHAQTSMEIINFKNSHNL